MNSAGVAILGTVGDVPVDAMWTAAQIGQASSGSPRGMCRPQSAGVAHPLACRVTARARSPACMWPSDTQSCSSMARRPTAAAIRSRSCRARISICCDAPEYAGWSHPEDSRTNVTYLPICAGGQVRQDPGRPRRVWIRAEWRADFNDVSASHFDVRAELAIRYGRFGVREKKLLPLFPLRCDPTPTTGMIVHAGRCADERGVRPRLHVLAYRGSKAGLVLEAGSWPFVERWADQSFSTTDF